MKGNNGELQELYGEQELIALIKKGRLRWLGHVERMDDNRVPKRMLCGRPGGRKEDRHFKQFVLCHAGKERRAVTWKVSFP